MDDGVTVRVDAAPSLEVVEASRCALVALLERYGITWTLLAPEEGTTQRLDKLRGWRRVYSDGHAVIHKRLDGSADAANSDS